MYLDIKSRIATKCRELGRDEPVLIAVSKMQPLGSVELVLAAGQKVFGENRVQEAQGKWPALQAQYGKVQLHLLGPLQTNKVNASFQLFDFIHSVDRFKLVEKLAQVAEAQGTCPQLFIQVNTGSEPQKAGVLPQDFDQFYYDVRPFNLPIVGLMCIPPADQDPRPHFRELRFMADHAGLPFLSMGMSGDFEIAIEEGATHIRVGSAIFGARDY